MEQNRKAKIQPLPGTGKRLRKAIRRRKKKSDGILLAIPSEHLAVSVHSAVKTVFSEPPCSGVKKLHFRVLAGGATNAHAPNALISVIEQKCQHRYSYFYFLFLSCAELIYMCRLEHKWWEDFQKREHVFFANAFVWNRCSLLSTLRGRCFCH